MALGTMTKVFLVVFLLLDFSGWAISLGGLAKLTDMCRQSEGPWDPKLAASPSALATLWEQLEGNFLQNTDKSRAYDCGVHYSLHWWIISLQLFVVVVGFLGSFSETLHSKPIFLHILAVSTTLYCLFAESYVTKEYLVMNHTNDYMKATAAAAAGAIIVLTTNFVVAILYGKESGSSDGPTQGKV